MASKLYPIPNFFSVHCWQHWLSVCNGGALNYLQISRSVKLLGNFDRFFFRYLLQGGQNITILTECLLFVFYFKFFIDSVIQFKRFFLQMFGSVLDKMFCLVFTRETSRQREVDKAFVLGQALFWRVRYCPTHSLLLEM